MNITLIFLGIFMYLMFGAVMAMFITMIVKYHCRFISKTFLKVVCVLVTLGGFFSVLLVIPIVLGGVGTTIWNLIDEE